MTISMVAIFVALLMRICFILPERITKGVLLGKEWKRDKKKRVKQCDAVVVLGSGGHTTEMLKLIANLPRNIYKKMTFIVADTDHTSIKQLHNQYVSISLVYPTNGSHFQSLQSSDRVIQIPRSREVGQSWISTLGTTLYALYHAFCLMSRSMPDVVLCNGPGTCIPICAVVLLFRFFGKGECKIIFCESFARVERLSFSGKLAYYLFADRFVVHWPELETKYHQAEYIGRIC